MVHKPAAPAPKFNASGVVDCTVLHPSDSTVARKVAQRLGKKISERVQVGIGDFLPAGAAIFHPDTMGTLVLSPAGVSDDALTHELRHVAWALQKESVIRSKSDSILAGLLYRATMQRVVASISWMAGIEGDSASAAAFSLSGGHGRDLAHDVTAMVVADSSRGGPIWQMIDQFTFQRRSFSRMLWLKDWTWRDELLSFVASEVDAYTHPACALSR